MGRENTIPMGKPNGVAALATSVKSTISLYTFTSRHECRLTKLLADTVAEATATRTAAATEEVEATAEEAASAVREATGCRTWAPG